MASAIESPFILAYGTRLKPEAIAHFPERKDAIDRPTHQILKLILHPQPRNLLKIPQILRRNNSTHIDRDYR